MRVRERGFNIVINYKLLNGRFLNTFVFRLICECRCRLFSLFRLKLRLQYKDVVNQKFTKEITKTILNTYYIENLLRMMTKVKNLYIFSINAPNVAL